MTKRNEKVNPTTRILIHLKDGHVDSVFCNKRLTTVQIIDHDLYNGFIETIHHKGGSENAFNAALGEAMASRKTAEQIIASRKAAGTMKDKLDDL